jgi:hypothetical protein
MIIFKFFAAKIKYIFLILILFSDFTFSQSISNGLIGYWKFDNSAIDEITGKSMHFSGSPQLDISKYGNAYHLNGTNYLYLNKTDSTKKYISEFGFSWSFWFKCDTTTNSNSIGAFQSLLSCRDEINAEDIIVGLGSDKTDKKSLVFYSDGISGFGGEMTNPAFYYPAGGFKSNVWYHVACVRDFDNDSVYLYLNNIKVASQYFKISPINRDLYFSVGADFDGTNVNTTSLFKGMIDEIRIYNKPLTDQEVSNINNINKFGLSAVDSVDLGEVVCQNSVQKNISILNQNQSTTNIKASLLSGKEFSINSISKNQLNNNESSNIQIDFKSNISGTYNDVLIIKNDNFFPDKYIYLKAKKSITNFEVFKIKNDLMDFGNIKSGMNRDSLLIIKNTGDKNITINSILIPKDTFNISMSESLPSVLLPNDSIIININLSAKIGAISNNLFVNIKTDCGDSILKYKLNYFGFNNAKLTLKVKDISNAKTGESVKIPIILQSSSDLAQSGISKINAIVSVNPTMLLPFDNGVIKAIVNGRLEIEYSIPINNPKDGDVLTELSFKAALGNSEIDTVIIKSINSSGILQDSLIPGIFTFDNICKQGGVRLFEYNSVLNLTQISPNPGNGILTLEFELIEQGITKIQLINENGEIIKVILNQTKDIGKYVLNFNSSDLPSGNYILILQTPTNLLTRKVSIIN